MLLQAPQNTHTHTHISDCTVSTPECIFFKWFLDRSDTFNFKCHFYAITDGQRLCYSSCTSGMHKPQTYTSAKMLKFLQLHLQGSIWTWVTSKLAMKTCPLWGYSCRETEVWVQPNTFNQSIKKTPTVYRNYFRWLLWKKSQKQKSKTNSTSKK